MRAAILHEFKQPLALEDVPVPSPAADEVLIKIEACGVCHSDLSIVEGEWAQLKRLIKKPLIPGHEVVGRVMEKGSDVHHLNAGDRVGVAWLHWACGECELCLEGLENLCPKQTITGGSVDGGYAEFIKAKASHALKVPENLTPEEAAPLFCAGITVYRAVKHAGIQPGQRLAVFGIGGLGHLAVQIAKSFGAQVMAVDIADDKLQLATQLGADQTMNASTVDVAKAFRNMGGVHAAIVASSSKAAYNQAFYAVRPAGTLVVVGLPSEDLSFPAIMMREIRIRSVATGTREDMRAVLELAATGQIRCLIQICRLEDVNHIFDQMRKGQIAGRTVIKI
ncbi:MAG TPA: zinc-dependent alcohol dehydrogenase [Candidatus Angelobacter sp.]|jgi:propanol-preferring alcohol dehydrogenase|nr:zinc-dependent alcohol dehydrogenase [Candidatus Angelobacter sp.]